jgi:uncharacterized protein
VARHLPDWGAIVFGTQSPKCEYPADLLVIQPTPFCNLDCDYCYLPSRSDKRRITRPTLERIFSSVFNSEFVGDNLTVVWHAGEPMVMPVAFYEDAFSIASAAAGRDTNLAHSFQTNGVLIDDRWCRFFAETHLRLGVSIDGPKLLHDAHRKTRRGRGTFDKVMRGIRRLQDSGIPFHVITVLTRDSLRYPDELFEFYLQDKLVEIAFNIEELEGANRSSSMMSDEVVEEYERFMARFLQLMKSNAGALRVREFDHALAGIRHGSDQSGRNHQVVPYGIISIDCDGNVSTFSPELLGQRCPEYGDFIFGNVHEKSLADILDNPRLRKLSDAIGRGVDACRRSCEYFSTCGGGAPANKYYENANFTSTETVFCRLTKQIMVDLVLSDLEIALELDAPATSQSAMTYPSTPI